MDVFRLRNRIIADDYASYVASFVRIHDARIDNLVRRELEDGALWPEPLVQLSPAFEPGETLEALVREGVLHPECLKIFAAKDEHGVSRGPLQLHRHQVDAIRAAARGENYVLTTGTGSGKSLAYIVPIVDHVLRRGSGKGIQAIVVYPMNALANSQLGELKKYLHRGYPQDRAPVRFARYTGQERDDARREIIANPPDILLTNYVMMEYLLTRPWDRQLIDGASSLRFLVFDELHTYRGRQGSDVAMLARRVREACRSTNVLNVGTSATLAGSGTWDEQRLEVAQVATKIFGATVHPESVIGETLRRTTPAIENDTNFGARLRDAVQSGERPPTSSLDAFVSHPLSVWIETTLGVRHVEGRLVRCPPRPLQGPGGAAVALARSSGCEIELCDAAISDTLLAGHTVRDEHGRTVFAFRLHQFVSKGDAVYASPESEAARHITLKHQQFVPDSDRAKVLLPLAFCRACGQEYYLTRRHVRTDGSTEFVPRDIGDTANIGDRSEAGFLHINTMDPWPSERAGVIERLPEAWLEVDKRGQLVVRPARRDDVPRTVRVNAAGLEDPSGLSVQWNSAPFRFCLRCRVAYSAHARSDFGKLATLGTEGRSTATTIQTLSALRGLRDQPEIDAEARKVLSFTDNRQDASLQAGHFNDFVEISTLRGALWRAVASAGPAGIRHDDLTARVFDALALPMEMYAANPLAEYRERDDTHRALREVLGYYLYRDLQRGWRVTSPNLEECGLLEVDYLYLRDFCREDARWANRHPVLASVLSSERERACRAVLDFMRRDLAIRVDALSASHQERIERLSNQHLIPPWALDEQDTMRRSAIAFPRSRGDDDEPPEFVSLSARGGLGMFLRRRDTFQSWTGAKFTVDETEKLLRDLLDALTVPGILARVVEPGGSTDVPGYQINAASLVWRAGAGEHGLHDPVRVPNPPVDGMPANKFFVRHYRVDAPATHGLEAREHTAQVPSEVRENREERFRNATLPVLFCSPTMELGVDISSLNLVHMRNVPPTPANYAQRSGRAGRSGQPAFVLTYCSVGSPHDQYFFRRPERMVAGSVHTPRIDLANEDLLRAHVHAIWLGAANLSLGNSLSEILDVSGDDPTLALVDRVKHDLDNVSHRNKALKRAVDALSDAVSGVLGPGENATDWIAHVLDQLPRRFDAACERWRSLYLAALTQSKRQQRAILDASRPPAERERARRLRAEAESQIRLLLDSGKTDEHSDFYSYRYFASEGFLPGYNFPRLPLSAFVPARKGHSRRGRDRDDDFLTRPRFLAITEFGPRTVIYHEGSRYRVEKVILPVDTDESALLQRAAQCESCGYLHPLGDQPAPDLCEHCGSGRLSERTNYFRMQNVSTRRIDRINSDEEERFRLGFELRTGVRFASRGGVVSAQEATLHGPDGSALARLVYGSSATIWRINKGWRRRQNTEELGFLLDTERGHWAKNKSDEEDVGEDGASRTLRVIPFVDDRRNCLVVIPSSQLSPQIAASLQSALESAIQVHYQLEDPELAAEPLPSADERKRILLYEASEGGAGVLRRLVEDAAALPAVARVALEIAHFDPGTGEDREQAGASGEKCDAACYDCLLSYSNQRDHALIDRKAVGPLLLSWSRGTVRTSPRPEPRQEHVARLRRLTQSDLERKWIDFFDRRGLKLPSDAQKLIEHCGARPDFVYGAEGAAVFVDGPVHDQADVQQRDQRQQDALEDAGYSVIRFRYSDDWTEVVGRYPSVFGRLGTLPPPGNTSTEVEGAPGLDLEDFDARWQPLVRSLVGEPGVTVRAEGDIEHAGRVVGFAPAVVSRDGRDVTLVDSDDPGVSVLLDALQARGRVAVAVRPGDADVVAEVLRSLGAAR